ncbi:hypothetical protein LTS18_001092, partial [Coniosporium uncinatum]
AAKAAEQLASHLQNQSVTGSSDKDVLEAQAYAYLLSGTQEFEKQAGSKRSSDADAQKEKWGRCLECFSAARVSYAALLGQTKQEMFKELLAGTTDPSIRYAAYQAHLPRMIPIPKIARQFFPQEDEALKSVVEKVDPDALSEKPTTAAGKAASAENIPSTISWRSRTANIVDGSIGQALAAVTTAEERLSSYISSYPDASAQEKAAAYDDAIIASQDASDATRQAIEELVRDKVDEGDLRMQDLRVTSLAVNYDVVAWRVGRNRVLIGKNDGMHLQGEKRRYPLKLRKDGKEGESDESLSKKLARLRDRVKLYDEILLSIDSVKELRGAVRDSAFIEELGGKRVYFQALKCTNIAYSH